METKGDQIRRLAREGHTPAAREYVLDRPQRTRYAIRNDAGRWLMSLGYAGGRIVALWGDRPAEGWTWGSQAEAVCAVLEVAGVGPWTVEGVEG